MRLLKVTIALVIIAITCLIFPSLLHQNPPSTINAYASTGPIMAPSWNRATKCDAVVLTIEQLIGSSPNPEQHAPRQGADYSGGALQLVGNFPPGSNPHSPWPYPSLDPRFSGKRSINPPCNIKLQNGTLAATLVEIHGVTVVGVNAKGECGSLWSNTCDETFHVCNAVLAPNCSGNYPDSMHMLHAEIDMNWVHFNMAPSLPTYGSVIDIQGFIYWDDAHLGEQWHAYSGWELHPVSAWRPATGSPPIVASLDYNPSLPSVGVSIRFNANVTGGTPPYSYGWNFGDGATITNTTAGVSHSFSKPGTYNVTLTVADTKGFRFSLYRIVPIQTAADFDLSSNPTQIMIRPGSVATAIITATSTSTFAGTLDVNTYVSSYAISVQLDRNTIMLGPASTTNIQLQITLSQNISPGTYTITIEATSNGAVRVATVNVNIPGFDLSVDSNSLQLPVNTTGNFTIGLASLGGFVGSVKINVENSNSSLASSLMPSTIQLSQNEYAMAILSVSSLFPGNYNLTVVGSTSNNNNNEDLLPLTVNVTRIDFAITTSSNNITSNTGENDIATVSVVSIGGFSGDVNLTANSNPAGLKISAPSRITLSPDGHVPVDLLISTGSASGKYSIIIEAISGQTEHSTAIALNIVSPPNQNYFLLISIGAALIIGTVLLIRFGKLRIR